MKKFPLIFFFCVLIHNVVHSSLIPINWKDFISEDMLEKYKGKSTMGFSMHYFQGDINGIDQDLPSKELENRLNNVINDEKKRWPNGVVPYVLSEMYKVDEKLVERTIIQLAMDQIASSTGNCIRFVERTNETDYIQIIRGLSCYSHVGMGGGKQLVSYTRGCIEETGMIQHELLNALGFYHEISRADRDDYVIINWDNLLPTAAVDFKVATDAITFKLPYDYDSVLHYPWNAFAQNSSLPTVLPKKKGQRIGQTAGLSLLDILKLRTAYDCPDAEGLLLNEHTPTMVLSDDATFVVTTLTEEKHVPALKDHHMHPDFAMNKISKRQCRALNTQNCWITPKSQNCKDGIGFFSYCSEKANSIEVTLFLSKIQQLNASRALKLTLDGKREFERDMFQPASDFMIILVVINFDGFQFSMLSSVGLPWLVHVELNNCHGVQLSNSDLTHFLHMAMIIFTNSTIASIGKGSFDGLSHLKEIALDNLFLTDRENVNEKTKLHLKLIHCDCETQWLRDLIQSKPYLIQARESGELHAWGGILSPAYTKDQHVVPVDCTADNLLGLPGQTEFSINTNGNCTYSLDLQN